MIRRGLYTAIVTPFKKDGSFDEAAFRKMIDEQVKAGVAGIVPCGSTGESPTLTYEEHDRVIRVAVEQSAGKCEVMAGTGSNSTAEAIAMTRHAAEVGATCSLQIVPYYNKPTPQGQYLHFKAIAESTDLPIIVYNIIGRTGINMTTDTLVKLAAIKNIVGVKESSGNINQVMEVIRDTPDDFIVLSGDDALTLPFMALGGDGVISVAANAFPERMVKYVDMGLRGDFASMRKEHFALLDLFTRLFCETNPIPIKTMLAMMGKIENVFRLPLCEGNENTVKIIGDLINKYAGR